MVYCIFVRWYVGTAWEYNIKFDLNFVDLKGVKWIWLGKGLVERHVLLYTPTNSRVISLSAKSAK